MRNTVLELLRVERVDPCRTINPKVTQFTITGRTVSHPSETRQVQTIRPLLASLCDRVKGTDQAVWITWSLSVYGKSLVKAELDRTKYQP